MKNHGMARRLLAFIIAAAICFSLVPWAVFAAENSTYSQVTTAEEFTSGQYVLVTDTGYAPGVLDGNWVTALAPTVENGVVTDTAGAVWTLIVEGSTVILTDGNGTSIAPKGGNANGITSGEYSWSWTFESGKLTFAGTGQDTVVLASNVSSDNKFRGYKTSTVSGNPGGYPSQFTAYKLAEDVVDPEPSEPAVPSTPAWNDVDAKYDVYELVTAPENGDTVVIYNPTNARAVSSEDSGYYKAGAEPEVVGENYIASDSETIQWVVSIDENGVYTFTQKDLTLGIQQSGSYFNLKTNAGDTGFTLEPFTEGGDVYQIYSATLQSEFGHVYLEWYGGKSAFAAYSIGDHLVTEDVFGFRFYKLVREGVAAEDPEEPTEPETPEAPTEPETPEEPAAPAIADGDYVIWAPQYNMALSSVYSGYYNSGVAVTMDGDKLSGYGETEIWTVTNNSDGTITISFAGQNLGMADSYSSMTLGEKHDTWTLEDAGNGLFYVKNADRETYIEWYASKNNWSSYYQISEGSEGMFTLQFTPAEIEEKPTGIADGDYVIWAPAYNMALSTVYGGYYNNGVAVTPNGDSLTGYGATEIWTVTNNSDGTITISCADGKLAMDTGYSSMPLNAVNDTWILEDAGDGLWYVKNLGRECYIEWYASKKYWSGYAYINEDSEGMFALRFTPVEKGYDTDSTIVEDIAQWGGMTVAENTAFVYGDKYVSGDEADTEDIFTAVVSGQTVPPWTKGGNDEAPLYYMGAAGIGSGTDDYVQFAVNAALWGDMELSFRLRASNSGPGSLQLMYSTDGGTTFQNFTTGLYSYGWTKWGKNDAGESVIVDSGVTTGQITDGKALTSENPGGYIEFFFDVPEGADNCDNLIIRLVPGTDKANGKSGSISVTGTLRVDSVVLSGSPIVDDAVTGYVTVTPDGAEDQPIGTILTMTSATEGAAIYYRVNGGQWQTYDESNKPVLDTLPCDIEAYASAEGKADSVILLYRYSAGTVEAVKFSPNGGGIYIEGESDQIILSTDTEGATIWFATSADGVTYGEFAEYTDAIVVSKGFGELSIQAYATKEGYRDAAVVTRTFTERLSAEYQIFFGQLHSHTNISDGSGGVEEAFQHASQVENLDFLAVTDHSNSFDGEGSGVLSQDGSSISSEWALGHEMAEKYTTEDFVGLYGFEMTWSNGLGHINTFNTPGWQSRTQADYKTQSTVLQNYYATLATVPESISQFNHPGTTFGDFSDFAHYSAATDALITLIEVGNGEGAIGSSGYFPSYEYYTRALDKGWHVAPTNNQDNHKGLWGDANTGRSVILADSLTEEGIYDALRNYRVYATEDNDLEIYYTLNGSIMGSQLDIATAADTVSISVRISDTTDAAIGRVEVIVNGGLSAASQTLDVASGTVELSVPADYNYYYIKITQPDGDIAVTAPVWVGKVEAVGISSLEAESALTIAGQEQTFTAELFNNERSDLVVESLVFTNKFSGEVIYTETGITSVPRESTATSTFGYTFASDGVYTITATLKGTLNGVSKTYTKDLEVTVMPKSITSTIIVDGTHYNDYVTGYYGGNMNNMTAIAASQGINVRIETNAITPEMLENCSLLIISAPAKKSGTANAGAYEASQFEDAFIEMVAEYVKNGGTVLVCGLADYQDKAATYGAEGHTAAQLNKLLAAMGSTMSVGDDEAYDEVNNGGQAYRLYPDSFNTDSQWCAGILDGQVYSQYSGCTVNPGQGTWLVRGFDTTYSIDSDNDGLGGIAKGEAYFLAVEETGFGGNIFVAGGVFVSDFEVKAELDNIWDLPYANRTIFENIIGITRTPPEITPIAEVRHSAETELGRIFVIEGYVTAGTDNANTTFFDAIYVQDETGGITVFPYAETGLELGTKVRITGYTDAYQGDIEIQIMNMEILEEPRNVISPEQVSSADAMNYAENGGKLLQVEGEVVDVILTSDGLGVAQFVVKDAAGDLATVFIDGYILSGTTGKNTLADIVKIGNTVSAVGLAYMHPEGDSEESVAVLRVRNCDEVVLISEKIPETDKSELEKAIEKAESLDKDDYSAKSWAAMREALKIAEAVYADETATQEEIDAAAENLNAAIQALTPPTGKNPETSDSFALELSLMTMTASLLALVVLIWNRRRFVR